MAKAMDIADMIITEAQNADMPVSNLKLQKVMYYLNVVHLLQFNAPLITDTKFEKWDYGPVIHSVYSEYSSNGAQNITEPAQHFNLSRDENGQWNISYYQFNVNKMSAEDVRFVRKNLDLFLKENPFYLVDKSHEEPQWKDKSDQVYNNQKTIEFYSQSKNKFWENK